MYRANVDNLTIPRATAVFLIAAYAITQADATQDTLQLAQTHARATPMSEGEVRKIDKEAGKITIKHGPIANLEMPGMTMVFRVKDPAMLDQVKEGDKIQFVADRINGALTVTQMESAK
jgi:Cu(I)/Ag(I) efflux system periplasmic protein CusF